MKSKSILNPIRSILTVLLLLLPSTNLKAQSSEEMAQLNLSTQLALEKLINNLKKNNNESVLGTSADLNEAISALYSKIETDGLDNHDSIFTQSLKEAQIRIEKLSQDTDMVKVENTLKNLTKDYYAKVNASPNGVGSNISTRVKVVVKAASGGNFLHGYNVRCNYMWDFESDKARFWSNSPTNDAFMVLAPGYYVIWLEKNGIVVKKTDVEIGAQQKETEVVTILL